MVIFPVGKNLENSLNCTLFGRPSMSARYFVKRSVCIDLCSSSYCGSACRYIEAYLIMQYAAYSSCVCDLVHRVCVITNH